MPAISQIAAGQHAKQDRLQNENLTCTKRACAGHRLWTSGGDVQALTFWGVLEELDLGKRVPDLQGLGYSMLGVNDSLTFTSNTWNITFDPYSGATSSPTPSRGPPHDASDCCWISTHGACCAFCKLRLCCIADTGQCMRCQARQHPAASADMFISIQGLLRMISDRLYLSACMQAD